MDAGAVADSKIYDGTTGSAYLTSTVGNEAVNHGGTYAVDDGYVVGSGSALALNVAGTYSQSNAAATGITATGTFAQVGGNYVLVNTTGGIDSHGVASALAATVTGTSSGYLNLGGVRTLLAGLETGGAINGQTQSGSVSILPISDTTETTTVTLPNTVVVVEQNPFINLVINNEANSMHGITTASTSTAESSSRVSPLSATEDHSTTIVLTTVPELAKCLSSSWYYARECVAHV